MSIDAQVVIMDEPTAALSYKEIEDLFVLIELLKQDGKAVLFISHKFDEIYRIADRYTVFRDGEMVGKGFIKDARQGQIVQMMVGRSVDHIFPQREARIGKPTVSSVATRSDQRVERTLRSFVHSERTTPLAVTRPRKVDAGIEPAVTARQPLRP